MLRMTRLAAVAATGLIALPAAAAPAPTATAPGGGTGAPKLTSLRLTRAVTAPQGHARVLVGARLSAPGKLTVTIRKPGDKVDLRSVASATEHAPGRAYLLVDAVDAKGFQLPAGRYVVRVRAEGGGGRSNQLSGPVTITLGPPLGRFDAFTVPLLPPFARQLGLEPGGQLVAVVAPKGSLAIAGVRRGDVVVSINGTAVATPGGLRVALSGIPVGTPYPVEVRRSGQSVILQATAQPDWVAPPDYGPALRVASRREPNVLAYQYAAVRFELDAGRPDAAAKALAAWPAARKAGTVGQLLAGDVALARSDGQAALAAYQRVASAEPQTPAGFLGQGLAMILQGQYGAAADALAQASTLDPTDASALSTRALALLRLDRPADALAVANQALTIAPDAGEAKIAQGVALVASGSTLDGLAAIRRGLLATADPARAASVIQKNLEPNDP